MLELLFKMALNLYRRHRQECEAEHPEESRSGEFEERSKKWRRCSCQIYASGTLSRKFRRRQTGKTIWEEAKAVAEVWEKAGRWDDAAIVPELHVPVSRPPAATINRAVASFLD